MCRETDLRSFRPQLIEIELTPGGSIDDGSGEVETVPSADHCGQRLLSALPIGALRCERSDPPAPGESDGGIHRLLRGKLSCRLAVGFVDPGSSESLANAASSISTLGKRPRFGQRKRGVVDEAHFRKTLYQALDLGVARIHPTAFADFSHEVGTQLGTRRRVTADIE